MFGRDYIKHDPENAAYALRAIEETLLIYWKQIQTRQNEIIRIANEKKENEAKIALVVFAGILLLGITASGD